MDSDSDGPPELVDSDSDAPSAAEVMLINRMVVDTKLYADFDVLPPAQRPRGELSLICGPMWAGKSSELLRRVRRYAIARKKIAVFTHSKDVRFGPEMALVTHDAVAFQAHAVKKLSGKRASQAAAFSDIIAVDEGQFFGDLAVACNKWADEGKIVMVAALDTTFERKPWDAVSALCPDYITKLTARKVPPKASRSVIRGPMNPRLRVEARSAGRDMVLVAAGGGLALPALKEGAI